MPKINKRSIISFIGMGLSSMIFHSNMVLAEDSFYDALTGGDVSFSARLRYESVEQENALKDADALTLRTTLGYKTGSYYGFGGFVEFEDVSDIGGHDYEEYPQTPVKTYSVIPDPNGTEVNQAYLSYSGFNTEVKLGRQEITYRNAPFHRFIGNVLWRQNHQSFDAISISNTSFSNTKLSYAYISRVNTIFGHDLTAGLIDDGVIDMDSHLFNVQYSGFPLGTLEAYSYLLDYQDAPKNNNVSTATYGLRLSGAQKINDTLTAIYTTEFATQDDYAESNVDQQNYYLLELGGKYQGWLAKLSYEVQQGDGVDSFKTPLGTNHAFQGWADVFLTTPAKGLKDMFVTVVGNIAGAKLITAYHTFETDEDSLDAGNEFDVMLQKTFMQHYTLGVSYADYNADKEFGGVDTEKFWLYGQVSF